MPAELGAVLVTAVKERQTNYRRGRRNWEHGTLTDLISIETSLKTLETTAGNCQTAESVDN